MRLFIALLITLVVCAMAAVPEHKITKLPGFKGELPSTHYSGYLPVGKLSGVAGQLHYWFIESTKDAANAPVVLWLNGGPGSSSLIGLLTENGQIMTNDNSLNDPIDGVPQVFLNPYSWTNEANVLYLESPKGVGFSYCEGAKTNKDCVNTDESTALDAYEFLVNFFDAYPEYKKNKFYTTGESYAGIYIPTLIEQLDLNPLKASINFVGAAIGNGCWGNTVGTCAFTSPEAQKITADFLYGHAFYSQTLREKILKTCGEFQRLTPSCISALTEMEKQAGKYNVYNIYDVCGNDQRRRLAEGESRTFADIRSELAQSTVSVSTEDSFSLAAGYKQALGDYLCGAETAMDAYLAHPDVIEALHVKANTVGMTYKKTATDLRPLYSELINKHQMLIYSGDTDGCVPHVGTEAWTRGLNFTLVNDWHQWLSKPDETHSLHKAGYAITYDKFQFVTINGAGHMVPQYQPAFAYTMFKKFLNNDTF